MTSFFKQRKCFSSTFFFTLFFSLSAQAVTVTSLNIKWFGRGGDLRGSIEDEKRQPFLKDYILNVLPESDVYVFQEIVNKDELFNIMIDFECISYDSIGNHQFVVMCSKKGILKSFEVNQEVRLERLGLRAAVVGNYEINNEVIKVIGVHLKAGRRDTQVRLEQIEALKKSFNETAKNERVIIVGDFNTFKTRNTNLELDDSELISLSLGRSFNLIKNNISTYMGFGGRVFDRAWIKNFNLGIANVIGPCKDESVVVPYSDFDYYKENISDHCALVVDLK